VPGCECEGIELRDRAQRRVLWALLAINGGMFFVEFVIGWLADSTGLMADSLDMLADATVYGMSLYAVGRTLRDKALAALSSGIFQIALAVAVLGDVTRRFFSGGEPISTLMIGVASVALVANVSCLALLAKHRHGEIHMRASWIFSTNDVLANIGVIIAGALVHHTGSRYPDLLVGFLISLVVLRGGVKIVAAARGPRARDP